MSEYIINTEQIEEINRAYGGMKTVTSWLSCYAIWDTSFTPPLMKSEHIAVTLPEIVRCGDCKHYKPWVLSRPENGGDCVLNKVEVDVWFDGFCVWGERREP